MTFKDQIQRLVTLQSTPKRIVSLVPSQTELLVDLGLEESLIGITKFCVHPLHLKKEKTIVGGTKQVDFEKIKALQPDIILCNKEENTLKMIEQLEKIAPVHISDISSISDCLELILMYGNLFSKENTAEQLVENIQLKFKEFNAFIKGKRKLKVMYFIWKSPWMVAAKNTFIDALLSINNFENVYQHLERYPEIDINDVLESDVIFLSSEPYPFKVDNVYELRELTPNAKILLVDGEYFSWYGSRLLKAFEYFKVLHTKHFNHLD